MLPLSPRLDVTILFLGEGGGGQVCLLVCCGTGAIRRNHEARMDVKAQIRRVARSNDCGRSDHPLQVSCFTLCVVLAPACLFALKISCGAEP
jgi:hypothetical protein